MQVSTDDLRSLLYEQRLRRIDYVIGRESIVKPARLRADDLGNRCCERDHIVAYFRLDFLNAFAGRFGTIAEYQYDLGLAYYGTRRYENAIAAFGKAIALDPKMDVAYFFTGNAWAGSGDPDKAVAFYRKAIGINPKSAGYYLALGKVLGLIGPERDPESAKWLRKGLALKPGDAASEFALALACERLNDLPCARPLLEDVVKRYPNELSPRIVLARIYAKMHEPEKARTEREAVKRLQEAQRRSNSERPSFSDSELHPPR